MTAPDKTTKPAAEAGRTGERPRWHALPAGDALGRLRSSTDGLSAAEAEARLAVHGPNRPVTNGGVSWTRRLVAQFKNVLLYVLIGSALITAAIGQWLDAAVIAGVVVVNAVIGFLQERKADQALEAIRGMLAPEARVRRGGQSATVAAAELVPGDVVLLRAGDKVPADVRLFAAEGLRLQEAALTGESQPVGKSTDPAAAEAALGDRSSMAYSGTLVTYGKGEGLVVATGSDTQIGEIGSLLREVQTLTTPLLRKIAAFSGRLTLVILLVTAATFAFGTLVQGYSREDMFMAAVGFAVAAIPEGLPPVTTIALALGVGRMAHRSAIIRRLPAVETLGSVTVICSDKTGTLTRNELMVRSLITAHASYSITGSGYAPKGALLGVDGPVRDPLPTALQAALKAGLLCNDALLIESEHAHWRIDGSPIEGALVAAAMKAGLDADAVRAAQPCSGTIPFDSAHKYMATEHLDADGTSHICVKGAPEHLLDMCSLQLGDEGPEPIDRGYWLGQINTMASNALRVLAVAEKPGGTLPADGAFDPAPQDLTLLALFGLIDPPRPEAVDAVVRCERAGIRVKMVTGDHAATAAAIAAEFGLGAGQVVTGEQLDGLTDAELIPVAMTADVFARTTPAHKLRLVEALQASGETVAMTGDGVNDAPALKRADIGIAMGQKGTEAAKEASEMVLTDDNFASIKNAVEEGRTVYDNLVKSIAFLLPTSGGQALAILAAVVMAQALPITPLQILWVNMITAVTLGLALAFEPLEAGAMERPPRRRTEPILTPFLAWRTVFVAILMVVGTYGMFEWALASGAGLDAARTIAVNTLVACEIAYLFNCRRMGPAWGPDGSKPNRVIGPVVLVMIGLQLLFTYAPPMQTLFATAAIEPAVWARAGLVGLGLFVIMEAEKALVRRRRARA